MRQGSAVAAVDGPRLEFSGSMGPGSCPSQWFPWRDAPAADQAQRAMMTAGIPASYSLSHFRLAFSDRETCGTRRRVNLPTQLAKTRARPSQTGWALP
jgi:hypothetical protein